MKGCVKVFEIRDCDDDRIARVLILEYSQIKGAERCFVSLEQELADLSSYYGGGALLIGYEDDTPVATIAIKKINDDVAEAKRLYIKPTSRGRGYARMMLIAMLDRCRRLGFMEVKFTTNPEVMPVAYSLYKRMSFEEQDNDNGIVSMRMLL